MIESPLVTDFGNHQAIHVADLVRQVSDVTLSLVYACVTLRPVRPIVAQAKCATHNACVNAPQTAMESAVQVKSATQRPVLVIAHRTVVVPVLQERIAIKIPALAIAEPIAVVPARVRL